MIKGRVIAAYGRQYVVELEDGSLLPCFPRGKKSEIACGDYLEVARISSNQGVVENICSRSSLLYRSNEIRQKLIAANVDQLIIVVATEPAFSTDLVTRALLAAESEKIDVLILLNKCDLAEKLPTDRAHLTCYANLGYRILELSARQQAENLRAHLSGKTSVLVGQSGMGKSTIINALIPGVDAHTQEISQALDSGKHTTTRTTLHALDAQSALIDSPGLQEFGLNHLSWHEIEYGFKEFHPYLGQCRFRDCRHEREPGCAIIEAMDTGKIDANRLAAFRRIAGNRRKTP